MKKTLVMTAMIAAMALTPANTWSKNRGVKDELTKTECGACHMVFQPRFLPAVSWTNIMSDLGNHFGEDATLDEETRIKIEAYLVKKARKKEFKKVIDGKQPIRITEIRWFKREHRREVSKRAMKRAGTMSNCVACHKGAERGQYDDD